MTKSYFNLTEGEGIVVQAAAQIYAAYIISGKVRDGEEKEWMRRAFKEAVSFAKTIDEIDDDEATGGDVKPKPSADASMPSRDELLEDMEIASSGGNQATGSDETGLRPLMEEMEDAGSDIDDVILEKGDASEGSAGEKVEPPDSGKPPRTDAGR